MTAFQPNDLVTASSVDEVIRTLEQYGDRARVIAGGTTIHELTVHGLLADVATLIDITALDLSFMEVSADGFRIGATTTFTDILRHICPEYESELDVLVDALVAIRPVQVRNVATVGGSLCCSLPFFDLPPALVALGAEVCVAGPRGNRRIPIDEFFVDYFTSDLQPDELVTEVVIPRPRDTRRSAFRKLETNSVDWALASVAVSVGRENGRCRGIRIALGGAVGRTVVRARQVESALEGQPANDDCVRAAAELVGGDVEPHSDFRASGAYRLEIYKVYIRRCIEAAFARMPY